MARYGSGYFYDMSELVIGIEEGLGKAFRMTCDQLLEDIKDWCDVDIYSQPESENYDRTGEFRKSWDYDIISVKKGFQEAQFKVDRKAFKTLDNRYHRPIFKGGTGDDMKNAVYRVHPELEEDIEFWIRDEFEKKYRANCKALDITLDQ